MYFCIPLAWTPTKSVKRNRAVQYSTKVVFMSRKNEVVPALSTKAYRGSRCIPPFILNLGSRGDR